MHAGIVALLQHWTSSMSAHACRAIRSLAMGKDGYNDFFVSSKERRSRTLAMICAGVPST